MPLSSSARQSKRTATSTWIWASRFIVSLAHTPTPEAAKAFIERIKQEFHLAYEPLLILAVGKSAERIERVEIGAGGDRRYYRSEGVHYVPKIRAEELIIDSDSAETGDKS